MTGDLKIYANYMAAIRDRINKVQTILAGRMCTGDKDLDAELIFTQFRKVVEGIAFALLAANKVPYSAKHTKNKDNLTTAWKAKDLLKRIEEINPDFYPIPILEPLIYSPDFKHFERVQDGFLTREDFVLLYQGSSEVMHERNPYSNRPPVIDVKYTVQEWVSRIQKLLTLHAVLVPSGDVWLAQIPGQGNVHVYLGLATPPATPELVGA